MDLRGWWAGVVMVGVGFVGSVVCVVAGCSSDLLGNLGGALVVTLLTFIVKLILNDLVTVYQVNSGGSGMFLGVLSGVYTMCMAIVENAPIMIRLLLVCFKILTLSGLKTLSVTVVMFKLGDSTCVSSVVESKVLSISGKRVSTKEALNLDCSGAVGSVMFPRTVGGTVPAVLGSLVTLLGSASITNCVAMVSLAVTMREVITGSCSTLMPCAILTVVCLVVINVLALNMGTVSEELEHGSDDVWCYSGV